MGHTKSLRPTICDLGWLIAPISVETFLQDYWDRAPLVVSRNQADYYSGLFSLDSADELVGSHPFRPGEIRYLPCERAIAPIHLTLSEDGFADSADVYEKYAQGASLFFYGIQKFWNPIAPLCRSLTSFFRMPSGATAVVSPPGVHSSPTHFDPVNNFLIQVEGSKRYRVYELFEALPIARHEKPYLVRRDLLRDPLYDIELQSGDVLFIPRGFVHEGFASEQGSVHVAAFLRCLTWADLLIETVEALSQRQPALRRALSPVIFESGDPSASAQEDYKNMLRLVLEEADLGEAVGGLTGRLLDEIRCLPSNHFKHLNNVAHIQLDTVMFKRNGSFCQLVRDGDSVRIRFPGRAVKGPASIGPALEYIASAEEFLVSSVPGLTDSGKLTLVRRLVKEGLLQIGAAS